MDRRTFISGVVGSLVVWSYATVAQQVGKLVRVGILAPASPGLSPPWPGSGPLAAFEEELRARGWVEGRNILIDRRYAEGRPEQYGALAAELVRLNVDVIVPAGGPASLQAARDATKTIPIVMVASSRNPIGEGLIKSFARPGGNITGLATAPAELGGKQLELLKQAVPALARVGLVWDVTAAPYRVSKEIDAAARSLGVDLVGIEVREPSGFQRAVANATKSQVGGLIVASTPMLVAHREEIAQLLLERRLPAVALWRIQAEAGLLMTYGPSIASEFRSAARYVDKILKGANPGDLPVEEPTKYEFVINLKTAKALGLSIPQTLLLRADEVIQ